MQGDVATEPVKITDRNDFYTSALFRAIVQDTERPLRAVAEETGVSTDTLCLFYDGFSISRRDMEQVQRWMQQVSRVIRRAKPDAAVPKTRTVGDNEGREGLTDRRPA
jgi:hypothetical protein